MLRLQEYRDNGRVACIDYTQLQENAARDVLLWSGSVSGPSGRLDGVIPNGAVLQAK